MQALVVIPARYGSTRLPGKPLLRDTGKFLVQHVYERCGLAQRVERVLVATDDERIRDAVRSFEGEVVMTDPSHPSGSDRVAEVATQFDSEVVINVQGDEPTLDARDLDDLVDALERHGEADVATLATPIHDAETFHNPHVVKVVANESGTALYFSRSPIPHAAPGELPPNALKHRGVYAYRRQALLDITRRPPVTLEQTERLEQLRAMHHGYQFQLVRTERDGVEVNTPEDYQRFVQGETA